MKRKERILWIDEVILPRLLTLGFIFIGLLVVYCIFFYELGLCHLFGAEIPEELLSKEFPKWKPLVYFILLGFSVLLPIIYGIMSSVWSRLVNKEIKLKKQKEKRKEFNFEFSYKGKVYNMQDSLILLYLHGEFLVKVSDGKFFSLFYFGVPSKEIQELSLEEMKLKFLERKKNYILDEKNFLDGKIKL